MSDLFFAAGIPADGQTLPADDTCRCAACLAPERTAPAPRKLVVVASCGNSARGPVQDKRLSLDPVDAAGIAEIEGRA